MSSNIEFEDEDEIAEFAANYISIDRMFSAAEAADYLESKLWTVFDYAKHIYINNDDVTEELIDLVGPQSLLEHMGSDVTEFVMGSNSAEDLFGFDALKGEIVDNYEVDRIFDEYTLGEWAEENGYVNRTREIEEMRVILDLNYAEGHSLVSDMYHQPIIDDTDAPIKHSGAILRALHVRQDELQLQVDLWDGAHADHTSDEHIRLLDELDSVKCAAKDILSQCRKLKGV
jgi:hypothetical protein